MDILGRDNWRNATTDLASVNARITKLTLDLTSLNEGIAYYKSMIDKCTSQGIFYSCNKNTGKTTNEWRDLRNDAQTQIDRIKKELSELQELKNNLVSSTASEAEALASSYSSDIIGAEASAKKAKSIVIWIGVGLLAIAGGALIYFKIIKKRK
jgi:predicted  nucleic acid-binding Zn-ribbon protein